MMAVLIPIQMNTIQQRTTKKTLKMMIVDSEKMIVRQQLLNWKHCPMWETLNRTLVAKRKYRKTNNVQIEIVNTRTSKFS